MTNSLSYYLRSLFARPFRTVRPDPAKLARQQRRPAADTTYAILFTPRSSSSRLTEILSQAKCLSHPDEAFNPLFVPKMAQAFNATTLEDYVDVMRRMRNTNGVMGFEATYSHIVMTFGQSARFRAITRPDHWFWLIREDIVLQAVSISRSRQSAIHHNTKVDPAALSVAEKSFAYDGGLISRQLSKLLWMEQATEAMFRRFGVTPVRLSYEILTSQDAPAIAALFAREMGVDLPATTSFDLTHKKLGTDKNLAFAERYRDENARFMKQVAARRAPMLAALRDPFAAGA